MISSDANPFKKVENPGYHSVRGSHPSTTPIESSWMWMIHVLSTRIKRGWTVDDPRSVHVDITWTVRGRLTKHKAPMSVHNHCVLLIGTLLWRALRRVLVMTPYVGNCYDSCLFTRKDLKRPFYSRSARCHSSGPIGATKPLGYELIDPQLFAGMSGAKMKIRKPERAAVLTWTVEQSRDVGALGALRGPILLRIGLHGIPRKVENRSEAENVRGETFETRPKKI